MGFPWRELVGTAPPEGFWLVPLFETKGHRSNFPLKLSGVGRPALGASAILPNESGWSGRGPIFPCSRPERSAEGRRNCGPFGLDVKPARDNTRIAENFISSHFFVAPLPAPLSTCPRNRSDARFFRSALLKGKGVCNS